MDAGVARVVIAGTASGVGKTTVTVGLVRALQARGLRVAAFKCGPDYLDPTYHRRAAGGPCHNLDGWMMGRAAVTATFARATAGADVAVIEGVMGLYDGASPAGEEGSTAEIAKWLSAPVLLVADASGMARSFAALVGGYARFDPQLQLCGAIANRVGSRGHLQLLREAARTGPAGPRPVLGALPDEGADAFPGRHLGLRTAEEDAVPERLFAAWGGRVAEWCDVDAILALARAAPPLTAVTSDGPGPAARRCRIGVAVDEAFHFYYEDNLARLEALGAELVRFSPIHDRRLPEIDGLYLGGGYPEAHAAALADNRPLRDEIRALAARGRPIYAECGGLMYLAQAIRATDGRAYPMAAVLPGEAVMSERLEALGYVEVETRLPTALGPAGLRFRGHQFRYSRLEGAEGCGIAYAVRRRRGDAAFAEGYQAGRVLGSYVHAHWASNPLCAASFVASCAGD